MLNYSQLIAHFSAGLEFFSTPDYRSGTPPLHMINIAEDIARGLGYQKRDKVMETLKSKTFFTETVQTHWRAQRVKYGAEFFWGSDDSVGNLGQPERYDADLLFLGYTE